MQVGTIGRFFDNKQDMASLILKVEAAHRVELPSEAFI
jgi:hypothetical protein